MCFVSYASFFPHDAPSLSYDIFLLSRERGQTLSGALSAACLMACSDVAPAQGSVNANRYKFLMAVDLRRFGIGEHADSDDWTGGTVACAGGAIDYVVKVAAGSGARLAGQDGDGAAKKTLDEFWKLAKRCKTATRDMVEKETLRWVQLLGCASLKFASPPARPPDHLIWDGVRVCRTTFFLVGGTPLGEFLASVLSQSTPSSSPV